jgi:hypothetical protein
MNIRKFTEQFPSESDQNAMVEIIGNRHLAKDFAAAPKTSPLRVSAAKCKRGIVSIGGREPVKRAFKTKTRKDA